MKIMEKQDVQFFNRLLNFTSKEKTRYYLNGFYIKNTNNTTATIAATDGYRLVEVTRPLYKKMKPGARIMLWDKKAQTFTRIEGKFPDYEHVIPKRADDRAVFTIPAEAAPVLRLCVNWDKHTMQVKVDKDAISWFASDEDMGGRYEHKQPRLKFRGSQQALGLNALFLLDAMTLATGRPQALEFFTAGPTRACGSTFTDDRGWKYRLAIMPMQLD